MGQAAICIWKIVASAFRLCNRLFFAAGAAGIGGCRAEGVFVALTIMAVAEIGSLKLGNGGDREVRCLLFISSLLFSLMSPRSEV